MPPENCLNDPLIRSLSMTRFPLVSQMSLTACHAAPPHQLTSGRLTLEPHQYPSAREAEVQEGRDPSTWRLFALSTAGHAPVPEIGDRPGLRSSPENGSSRDHAGLEGPPKRDDQFSRDGDDRDLPYSALQSADPFAKPSRQPTFGLMPQP